LITFALDTSTPSPSLALLADEVAVAELRLAPVPAAGRRVLQAAHGLLTAAGTDVADVGRVVVGLGPGGFTGLRIGISTALGLGQALGCPVVGAVSLEALALGIADVAGADALLVPVVDARRREVFAAVYRALPGDVLEVVMEPTALAPADLAATLAARGAPALVAGDGAALVAPHATPALRVLPPSSPAHALRAAALARRVATAGARPVTPLYARLPDAEVNRRRAEAGGA